MTNKTNTQQPVTFEVVNIGRHGRKEGCVVVEVRFNEDPERTHVYVRKLQDDDTCLVDGCKLYVVASGYKENGLRVTHIERMYETKGRKRKSTETLIKKTSVRIKEELESMEIEIPEMPQVENGKEEEESKEEVVLEETKAKEVKHEKYDEIKSCLECNIPVFLVGAAGSGKNYTIEQIAKDLNWNFYFSNSVQQEYKLTGFIDAGGTFHETEFSKACKEAANGKDVVFFLDEIDASIPEVLVLLNAAIANGYFEFPDGKVNFKDKVHFIAAGNTVGSGADEMYTGRMVLDQATLDRFAIIEFDYSMNIEMHITNGNADLVAFVRNLRDEASNKGIRATFSYRCLEMVTKLEKTGMKLETILKISIVKGLDQDTINTLNPLGNTKYNDTLRRLQKAA